MLARTPGQCQKPEWVRELAEAYTRPQDLLQDLGLNPGAPNGVREASGRFSFLVTRAYAASMRPGDPDDPLLRQVLPSAHELVERPGYSCDPVGDQRAVHSPGLLRKYRGRVLLMLTGACAVHCRYCFRRHFPYPEASLRPDRTEAAVNAIAADPGVSEVILSGGDPLTWEDDPLGELIGRMTAIRHLRRLRLHTRIPVVLPSRVTQRLCRTLAGNPLTTLVVVQVNHRRELSGPACTALVRLREAGLTMLNQSVLLRGVNDDAETLAELSESLLECGVLPYYLHLLDPVSGAAHFEVRLGAALALMNSLRGMLPGYLVPRLVRETAGGAFKEPLL